MCEMSYSKTLHGYIYDQQNRYRVIVAEVLLEDWLDVCLQQDAATKIQGLLLLSGFADAGINDRADRPPWHVGWKTQN